MSTKPTRAVARPATPAPDPTALLPVKPVLPAMSAELRAEMSRFMDGGDYPGQFRATAAMIAEAAALLPAMEPICGPPTPAQIDSWLLKLQKAVSNPPSETDHKLRLEAVYFALGDLPSGCWSYEALAEAMRHFKFWPTVAELDGFLRPKAVHLRRLQANLTAMSKAAPYRAPRPRLSDEEAARQVRYDRIAEESRKMADELGVSIVDLVRGLGSALSAPHPPRQNNVIDFAPDGGAAPDATARFPALKESIRRGRARLKADPTGVGREAQQSVASTLRKPSSDDAA